MISKLNFVRRYVSHITVRIRNDQAGTPWVWTLRRVLWRSSELVHRGTMQRLGGVPRPSQISLGVWVCCGCRHDEEQARPLHELIGLEDKGCPGIRHGLGSREHVIVF